MSATQDDAHGAHGGPTEVESEGISAGFLFGIIAGTIVVVVILVIVGFTVATVKSQEIRDQVTMDIQYPELRDVRAEAAARLNHYAVVDAENDVYQVPIDQAMRLMANEAYQQQAGAISGELTLTQPAN